MATFEGFPFDILYEISKSLDFLSILNLASTCIYLRAVVDPFVMARHKEKVAFFLKAERFPQHNDPCRLTCFRCWKLLSKDYFGRNQARDRMGKNTISPLRSARFCWDCAVKHRLYPEQRAIRKGSFLWYLCYDCGEYKLKSQRCVQEELDDGGEPVLVRRCGKSTVSSPSAIEQLPTTVQEQIFENLRYRDCIMLSQTSRHFQAVVSPQNCPVRDKFLFVHRRASRKLLDYLPCYACFRARGREKFTDAHRLPANDEDWSKIIRQCRECLSRSHQPTAAGRALLEYIEKLEYCSHCREIRRNDQDCIGCQKKYLRWTRNLHSKGVFFG